MSNSATLNETRQSTSRLPCQRDFEIFRMAEILGLTHERIASVCRLTRRRVSQIVEIVRDWLSNNPCEDPQLATELQRKRLAQHLERMRLQDVIDRARAALDLAPEHLTTVHVKADGSQSKTIREQPPIDVQVLKTYLRAIQALGKFHQEPEVPYPPPAEGEFLWAKEAMNEVLARWYEKVCSRSIKFDDFYDFADELIGAFIKALSLQQPAPEESVGSALRGVPRATDDTPVAESAEAPEVEAPAEPVGRAVPATQARSESEGPGDETTLHFEKPCSMSPSPLVSLSSPSASVASQREVPASEPGRNDDDAAIPYSSETSTPSLADKTSPATAPPSQENPKREAPPLSISPSLCPSVSPSPFLSLTPES